MNAIKIYQKLEKDFITSKLSDEWKNMEEIASFISNNFKERQMGLVCDFANKITKVYTAVFPSDKVMQEIINNGVENAMLFVHHPMIWDITDKKVFLNMNKKLLQKFKDKKVSIYNLHVPLDNFGKYSTASTLAEAVNINIKKPFYEYHGGLAGIFGTTKLKTINELSEKLKNAVKHKVGLYKYGNHEIKDSQVAIVTGGGNDITVLKEIQKNNINTFITGVTVKNEISKTVHNFAKKHKINILGGTHYSTEKFACVKMVKFFEKIGIKSEFIEDMPMLEDL
jgi:putative NIF3 family GTP cyclohydrolase 1 type 2